VKCGVCLFGVGGRGIVAVKGRKKVNVRVFLLKEYFEGG